MGAAWGPHGGSAGPGRPCQGPREENRARMALQGRHAACRERHAACRERHAACRERHAARMRVRSTPCGARRPTWRPATRGVLPQTPTVVQPVPSCVCSHCGAVGWGGWRVCGVLLPGVGGAARLVVDSSCLDARRTAPGPRLTGVEQRPRPTWKQNMAVSSATAGWAANPRVRAGGCPFGGTTPVAAAAARIVRRAAPPAAAEGPPPRERMPATRSSLVVEVLMAAVRAGWYGTVAGSERGAARGVAAAT
jgi:hypothetical protein